MATMTYAIWLGSYQGPSATLNGSLQNGRVRLSPLHPIFLAWGLLLLAFYWPSVQDIFTCAVALHLFHQATPSTC